MKTSEEIWMVANKQEYQVTNQICKNVLYIIRSKTNEK